MASVLRCCSSVLPASVKQKHSSGEEDPWENQPEKHQIEGWKGVSAAGLQGKGSPKRSVFFTDTGIGYFYRWVSAAGFTEALPRPTGDHASARVVARSRTVPSRNKTLTFTANSQQ